MLFMSTRTAWSPEQPKNGKFTYHML
jgi:hypothetical protein